MDEFLRSLHQSLSRQVASISVTILHGMPKRVPTASDAIAFILDYDARRSSLEDADPVSKFEVDVRYSNGDVIHASFHERDDAIAFLQTFQ